MTTLPLRFTRPTAEMPTRAHPTDAGLDLHAAEAAILEPLTPTLVPTGIAVAVPDGHVGYLHVRSSLAAKRWIMLANGVGVIDPDYRGEILVPLVSLRGMNTIPRGERIAQLVIVPCVIPTLDVVPTLPETVRGAGGFGFTGVN